MLKSQDIAVIGALLTIVAMAVDPFTQQIVQYHSCPIVAEGERAMVPYSNNYTAGFWGKPTNSPHVVVVTKSKQRQHWVCVEAVLKFSECSISMC